MAGGVDWMGEQWFQDFVKGERKNISAASIYLANQVKADISQPGTLRYSLGKTKKGKLRQRTIYNFTHSARGNPPFKQTGRLRASITWELVGTELLIGRVGTNVIYARRLEIDLDRPYLRPNLLKHGPMIRAILLRQVRAGAIGRPTSNQFRSGVFGAGARKAGFR